MVSCEPKRCLWLGMSCFQFKRQQNHIHHDIFGLSKPSLGRDASWVLATYWKSWQPSCLAFKLTTMWVHLTTLRTTPRSSLLSWDTMLYCQLCKGQTTSLVKVNDILSLKLTHTLSSVLTPGILGTDVAHKVMHCGLTMVGVLWYAWHWFEQFPLLQAKKWHAHSRHTTTVSNQMKSLSFLARIIVEHMPVSSV